MDKYPVFQLEAVEKKYIASFSPVVNHDEFDFYVWIHIPVEISREFSLYNIDEMSEPIRTLNLRVCCYHDKGHPWYRLRSSDLNLVPGLHIYRMQFVNKHNNDVVSLFFGYVIQCDHPDKPYRYMDPGKACNCDEKDFIRIQAL